MIELMSWKRQLIFGMATEGALAGTLCKAFPPEEDGGRPPGGITRHKKTITATHAEVTLAELTRSDGDGSAR
ncbi:hypothetical protein [Nonomuraea dietziae]|uniref:hypothetical protein n=1 Tax=Nonomuraea dietziae TaxID=65515 RepID=UPI0031D217F4